MYLEPAFYLGGLFIRCLDILRYLKYWAMDFATTNFLGAENWVVFLSNRCHLEDQCYDSGCVLIDKTPLVGELIPSCGIYS